MVTSRKEIEGLQEEILEIHAKFRRVRKALKKNPDNPELQKKKIAYRERMESLESQVNEAIEERRLALKKKTRHKKSSNAAADTESSKQVRRHPRTREERDAQIAARKVAEESAAREVPSAALPDNDPSGELWVLSDSQSRQQDRFDVGDTKFHKRIIVPPSGWLAVTFFGTINAIRTHPVRILMILLLAVVMPVGGIIKFKLRFHEITSRNAEPTMEIGEKVLVWIQPSYRAGDLIVVPDPYNPNIIFTRRVVAVSGDEVEIRDRRLFVNNEEVQEPYVTKRAGFDFQTGPMEIRPGQVYALSDNRSLAPEDSLSYIGVSTDTIQGKILFRYFPRSRLGFLE